MDFEHNTPSPEWYARRYQEVFWNLPASAQPQRKGFLASFLEPLRRSQLQPKASVQARVNPGSTKKNFSLSTPPFNPKP